MKLRRVYDELECRGDELRDGDRVVAIGGEHEDGIVIADSPELAYINVSEGAYSDGLTIAPDVEYLVLRPSAIDGVLAGVAEAAESWLAAPSASLTCSEAAKVRELLALVAGEHSATVRDFDEWHASTDDEPEDCSHALYLAQRAGLSDG